MNLKSTLIILLLAIMLPIMGQTVSQAMPKEALASRIERIKKAAGVEISFDRSAVKGYQAAAVADRGLSAAKALERSLAGTPFTYSYTGGAYVVSRRPKTTTTAAATPTRTAAPQQSKPATGRGTISGTVVDSEGSPVIGATIMVVGMASKGAVTDIRGRYTITDLPVRPLTIEASCVSYQKMRVADVKVQAGHTTPLDLILQEATNELRDVVVTATYNNATANSLLAQQKNRSAMSDGMSADLIRRTPDNNVAQVLGRVAGVTIEKGKFVVVRGMSERYNNVQLNGAALPSTEPNKRNFAFDVIPSNLVDKVTIAKTFTPDLPGEFTGGLVEVATLAVPTRRIFDISVGTGINTISTGKTMLTGKTYASDYLFGNTKDRTWAVEDPTSEGTSQSAKNAGEKNPYQFFRHRAQPLQNYSLTFGLPFTLHNGHKLGAVLALTYRNEQTMEELKEGIFINRDTLMQRPDNKTYKFLTATGAVLNMGWQMPGHRITLRNLYNNRFTHATMNRSTYEEYSGWKERELYSVPMRANVWQTQMDGEHHLLRYRLILSYNLSYNETRRTNPSNVLATGVAIGDPYTTNLFDWSGTFWGTAVAIGDGHLMYSKLKEHKTTAAANAEYRFEVAGNPQRLKAGYMGTFRRSRFFQTYLKPLLVDQFSPLNIQVYDLPLNQSLAPEWFAQDILRYYGAGISGPRADWYQGRQDIHAGYFMGEFTFLTRFHLTAGLRLEDAKTAMTDHEMAWKDSRSYWLDSTTVTNKLQPLPAATLVYNITSTLNARAAFSQTLARPDFRELTRTRFYRVEDRMISYSAGNLKETKITNYDLRLEWYPALGEVLSLSFFYKHFKDPLEVYTKLRQDGHNYNEVHDNLPNATAKGIELNVRKSLGFIAPASWLRDLWLTVNGSLLWGTVDVDQREQIEGTWKTFKRDRPLMGLAPFTINTGLNYTGRCISAAITYARSGRSLLVSAEDPGMDIYENPRNVIDLQLAARFLKERLELKLNVSDLLHEDYVTYRNAQAIYSGGTSNGIIDLSDKGLDYQKGDWVVSRIGKGVNISLSLSYKI